MKLFKVLFIILVLFSINSNYLFRLKEMVKIIDKGYKEGDNYTNIMTLFSKDYRAYSLLSEELFNILKRNTLSIDINKQLGTNKNYAFYLFNLLLVSIVREDKISKFKCYTLIEYLKNNYILEKYPYLKLLVGIIFKINNYEKRMSEDKKRYIVKKFENYMSSNNYCVTSVFYRLIAYETEVTYYDDLHESKIKIEYDKRIYYINFYMNIITLLNESGMLTEKIILDYTYMFEFIDYYDIMKDILLIRETFIEDVESEINKKSKNLLTKNVSTKYKCPRISRNTTFKELYYISLESENKDECRFFAKFILSEIKTFFSEENIANYSEENSKIVLENSIKKYYRFNNIVVSCFDKNNSGSYTLAQFKKEIIINYILQNTCAGNTIKVLGILNLGSANVCAVYEGFNSNLHKVMNELIESKKKEIIEDMIVTKECSSKLGFKLLNIHPKNLIIINDSDDKYRLINFSNSYHANDKIAFAHSEVDEYFYKNRSGQPVGNDLYSIMMLIKVFYNYDLTKEDNLSENEQLFRDTYVRLIQNPNDNNIFNNMHQLIEGN